MTAGVLLVSAVLLTGCGGGAGRPTGEPSGAPPTEFTASFAEEGGALVVRYRVRNTSDGGLVVYNGVTADAGFGTPSPDAVYVTAGPADAADGSAGRVGGVVEIAKRVFDVPPGVDLDARALIRGRILAPGEELSERVLVPLPLTPSHPYGAERAGPLPDPVRQAVFCLGVAAQSEFPERLRFGVPTPSASGPAGAPSASGPAGAGVPSQSERAGTGGSFGYYTHPSPQHLLCSTPYEIAG